MMHDSMITLAVEPDGTRIQVPKGTKILDALKKAGLSVRSECGGREICGKCKVVVLDRSKISGITDSERARLSLAEMRSGFRLACVASMMESARIFIPEESRLRVRRLLIEGAERAVSVEPAIKKFYVTMSMPTLQDARSDLRRLLDSLNEVYGLEVVDVDSRLMRRLPETLRRADWTVTVTVWDERKLVSVEKGDTTNEALGIAVDIGTSKIVGYLSNLVNGELIQTESLESPQIAYGEDIISRIAYAQKSSQSLRKLQKLTIDSVNTAISKTCKKSGRQSKHIYEVTVAGNTVMHHIFLGLQPRYLGLSPHVPVAGGSINEASQNLSLRTNPFANVYVFPVIAGFVGGDAVADIIATGIYESPDLSMLVDIGTNTEVVLGNKRGWTVCSCASGPAFEGAHIKCGMKAVTGAIDKLEIEAMTHKVKYQTIDNAQPVGLCGSGIIDTVASLLKSNLIDRNGTFTKLASPKLKNVNGEKAFMLVSEEEGASRDIVVTQKDVREIQLAKAAVHTGCYMLVKRRNIKLGSIRKLYVAGAFGNYVNLENAKLIGMLPDVPAKLIRLVGNAAGAGARMALISRKLRDVAAVVSQKACYLELAAEPDFQSEFASAMCFPHADLNRFKSVRHLL